MWSQANMYTSPTGHLREPANNTSLLTRKNNNPTEYFDIAVYFFDSTFMLLLFLVFGRKREDVFAVFQELQIRPRKYRTSFKRVNRYQNVIK